MIAESVNRVWCKEVLEVVLGRLIRAGATHQRLAAAILLWDVRNTELEVLALEGLSPVPLGMVMCPEKAEGYLGVIAHAQIPVCQTNSEFCALVLAGSARRWLMKSPFQRQNRLGSREHFALMLAGSEKAAVALDEGDLGTHSDARCLLRYLEPEVSR